MLLGTSLAMIGQYLAFRLRKRVELLDRIMLMLNIIESQVNFLATPSAELFKYLSEMNEFKALRFLNVCAEKIQSGETFPDSWKQSLMPKSNVRYLTDNDVELLNFFGESFGKADIKGETSNCTYFKSLLKENIRSARNCKDKYGKLYSGLGLLVGVAIVIVLY